MIYLRMFTRLGFLILFFFNDTATTEIYTLSLHDALPICAPSGLDWIRLGCGGDLRGLRTDMSIVLLARDLGLSISTVRSEEHTSELQSQSNLVCRLLLEKKKCLALDPCRAQAATIRNVAP